MFDDQSYYRQGYAATPGEFAFRANDVEQFQQWQAAFRPKLRQALGLDLMQADFAGHRPRAEQIDSESLDGYTRQRWRLWVEPQVALPFYLLRPQDAVEKRPLVLCPHGHNWPHIYAGVYENEDQRKSIAEGDRDIAVQAVREGYIAIAPTARGFGETRTQADVQAKNLCSCRTQLLHGLLLGYTPIGQRVWDIERLLDWAQASLPIDASRIAITGNSGGGTISLFAAACDPRITVAVPSCYFCTFAGSIGSIHHCDCNYVPGILRLGEMPDIAGLIAPRPFCAISGQTDDIFPVAEVRKAFAHLQRIYTVAGIPENCQLHVGKGGHRYYRAGAWPFVREHFQRGR